MEPSGELSEEVQGAQRIMRSSNFSAAECALLIRCVRAEKQYVFTTDINSSAVKLRNQAWERITAAFNKENLVKRPTKVLRTRFDNMKKLRRLKMDDVKHQSKIAKKKRSNSKDCWSPLQAENKVKLEHKNEITDSDAKSLSSDISCLGDPPALQDPLVHNPNGPQANYTDPAKPDVSDELKSIQYDEVTTLNIKLLEYKLETAKLERERLKSSAECERRESEAREMERLLRVRAARLAAAAAELALPEGHPARRFTRTEAPLHAYLLRHGYL